MTFFLQLGNREWGRVHLNFEETQKPRSVARHEAISLSVRGQRSEVKGLKTVFLQNGIFANIAILNDL